MRKIFVVVLLLVLSLAGCQPIEKTARDALGVSKGFLDQVEADHLDPAGGPTCIQQPLKPVCVALKKAGLTRNVVIDALEIYCSGMPKASVPAFNDGGPCVQNRSGAGLLQQALKDLNRNIADVSALVAQEKRP